MNDNLQTLVAINITSDGKLLNGDNCMPILFDYRGDFSSIGESLRKIESFQSLVYKKCLNKYDYPLAKISYFFYDDGAYSESVINVQDLYMLDSIADVDGYFWKEFAVDALNDLYKMNYSKKYSSEEPLTFEDEAKSMVKAIIAKNNEKVTSDTIGEYVRSSLSSTNLSQRNISHIVNWVKNIN